MTRCCRLFCLAMLLLAFVHIAEAELKSFGLTETEDIAEEVADGSAFDLDMPTESYVEDVLRRLDLRQKICRLMFVSLQGSAQPNAEDREFLRNYPPAGVIVPMSMRPESAYDYINSVNELNRLAKPYVPLFISANAYDLSQNGRTIQQYFTQLPTLMSIAAIHDNDVTKTVASLIAEHMDTLGFNTHLGPSLALCPLENAAASDVDFLGDDAEFASDTARIFVEAFDERNVIAIPTGFPGKGIPAAENSLIRRLGVAGSELHSRLLLPYREAIAAGASIIHVGAVRIPRAGEDPVPACLSQDVLEILLRDTLRYDGLILAGPFDSPEMMSYADPSKTAILSLKHGTDMLMWNGPPNRMIRAVEEIVAAVGIGYIDEARIDDALRKVLTLKHRKEIHKRKKASKSAVRKLESRWFRGDDAVDMERKAVTLAVLKAPILPLKEKRSEPIGVTGTIGVVELHNALEKHFKRVAQQTIATAKHLGSIQDFEIDRVTNNIDAAKTIICVFDSEVSVRTQTRLVDRIKKKGIDTIVVLVGPPVHLTELAKSNADAILLTYPRPGLLTASMQAVADSLSGEPAIAIHVPGNGTRLSAGAPFTLDANEFTRTPAGSLPMYISREFPLGHGLNMTNSDTLRSIEWQFGDGAKSKDALVTHQFNTPGRYTLTLTATDLHKSQSAKSFDVTVE